jgi:chemotaxis protein histidine kinase CheA
MSAQIEMNNNEGGFNAQVFVSEQLNRQLINTTQDTTIRCIEVLAAKFNFDAEEAIKMLGLNMMKLERKTPSHKGAKEAKPAKFQAPKLAFPLPYNGELNEACCYALRQNNGLYTQCSGTRKGEAHFCKGCASQMQKVGAETPEYGTIQQRMAVGIFEYVDPKGRKPIAYAKIMKKYKLTEEQVKEEAGKLNIVINEAHFEAPEETKRGRPKSEKVEKKEKGAKGRPKKTKKVVMIEDGDDDLFAALVAEANEEDVDEVVVGKKKGKSDEEKEAERLQKEAEKAEKEAKRLAEKAEKEAKLAAEKAEKEAKKKADEEARLAKKAAEEAEKKAKKEAAEKAKALAEQKKEAKLAAEKEAKEALAKQKKAKKSEEKPKVEEEEDDEEQEVFQKVVFEGKKYLKSTKTNIVYDYLKLKQEDEQVVVGKWIEADQKLIFNDAEESEDEYDE